jgi:hypothetical protein
VVGQTPDGGEVDTDPQNPVKFRLTVCLDSDEYVQTCSASKINKATKKAGKDSPAVVQAVLDELKKCRVDYDVRFSKKADDAVFRPATNLPAPKRVKRKPINQVVECPTDPAVQGLRIILDEGARSGNSYASTRAIRGGDGRCRRSRRRTSG